MKRDAHETQASSLAGLSVYYVLAVRRLLVAVRNWFDREKGSSNERHPNDGIQQIKKPRRIEDQEGSVILLSDARSHPGAAWWGEEEHAGVYLQYCTERGRHARRATQHALTSDGRSRRRTRCTRDSAPQLEADTR